MALISKESVEQKWASECEFPKLLFHDDACHMLPYVKKRAEQPNSSWVLNLLAECDMRVDRFHLDNHCEDCKRNYTVDGQPAWDDINMSACEQFFGWMYELKSSFRRKFRTFAAAHKRTTI